MIEKLIKNRRSIRKYQDKKIPSDILDQLIESARLALQLLINRILNFVVDEPEKVQALEIALILKLLFKLPVL